VPVLNVVCVSGEILARSLGKATDDRDVESYVHKEIGEDGPRALAFLRPRRHPERLRPLLAALDVANHAVIEVNALDAALGETLVAVGAAGIAEGVAVIAPPDGEWVDPEQVRTVLDQAGLSRFVVMEGGADPHAIREHCWNHLEDSLSERSELERRPLAITVDQHFNVKGVGLVVIGTVQSGTVSTHDEVAATPTMERGVVRSLQVMDDDVETARAADRVGVALRNLREDSIARGSILVHATDQEIQSVVRHRRSSLSLERSPFQLRDLSVGTVIHASVDLQFVVGRIDSMNGDRLTIEWEGDLYLRPESNRAIVLSQLDSGSMRILGIAFDVQSGGD